MVLGGGRRGPRARVLRALGAGRRPLARPRVGDLVLGREAEHRLELRAPVAERPPGCGLPRRGRSPPVADLRRALGRGHAAGGAPGRARGRGRRPRRDLLADVARGGDRLPRLRARRRGPGAGLLRVRGAGRRPAARRLRGQGRDHGARVAPPRTRGADARDPRGGAAGGAGTRARARRPVGRGGGCLPRHAGPARGRLGASVPAHLHLGDDGQAEGRSPRPRRVARLDHAGGRLPRGHPSRRRPPLRDRHGLDHGPLDSDRRRCARRDDRLRRRRARLAARPALAADRGGARDHARVLADADPRADPPRRSGGRPLVAADDRHDGRAVEPRPVPLALRAGRRRALPDRQHHRRDGGRRGASSGRVRRSRSRTAPSAGRRREWRWTSSTPRAGRWSAPARSASSSAGSRSRG